MLRPEPAKRLGVAVRYSLTTNPHGRLLHVDAVAVRRIGAEHGGMEKLDRERRGAEIRRWTRRGNHDLKYDFR